MLTLYVPCVVRTVGAASDGVLDSEQHGTEIVWRTCGALSIVTDALLGAAASIDQGTTFYFSLPRP